MSTAFGNNPSSALLAGFHSTMNSNHMSTTAQQRDASETRLLLYQAYHATVSIVTEFYRPRSESTARELAARRKLTEVLMRLEEVKDGLERSRHKKPSGETSLAKKPKSD